MHDKAAVVPDESLITERVRAAVGRTGPGRPVSVEQVILARLREALGAGRSAEADAGGPVPVYALSLLLPEDELLNLTPELPGSLVVGDEWELHRPPRVAEPLTIHSQVTEAYERFGGRFGQMLYLRCEWIFLDASGERVATARRIVGRYRSSSGSAAGG